MIFEEIYKHIDQASPFELQESWDNSGMIVGRMDDHVERIVVTLDVDEEMIEEAEEGTLFVVHHPLIFSGLKQIDLGRYPSNLLTKMIRKKQSMIAAHTNFDKTHLNRYVFTNILGFTLESEKPFICQTQGMWHYHTLLLHLKERLDLPHLRVVGKKETIRTIAMTTGSGASLLDEVDADCFLTGDIKYHDATKALSEGKMLIDIGHYESERFFGEVMGEVLKNLPVLAIITPPKNPFRVENL
jgi:dinuclear metal center YbgI/SA1388 family protein